MDVGGRGDDGRGKESWGGWVDKYVRMEEGRARLSRWAMTYTYTAKTRTAQRPSKDFLYPSNLHISFFCVWVRHTRIV